MGRADGASARKFNHGCFFSGISTTLELATFPYPERARIIYAGPAPGEVAGVIQVNAVVPDIGSTGPAVPIVLSVSPPQGPLQAIIYASQAGATIAVQ